jgi:hypothetical protein
MFVLGLRFAFVLVRIFGDPVEVTFDSWVWPLLLWLFPPGRASPTCSCGRWSAA